MLSYEEAEMKLTSCPVTPPIDYDNFILGFCRHMGLGDFGQDFVANLQEIVAGKRAKRENFVALNLVTILFGMIKMGIGKVSSEHTALSANLCPYLLDYLIEDESVRNLAIIIFNRTTKSELGIEVYDSDIHLVKVDSNNVGNLVNLALNRLRDLPTGIRYGTILAGSEALVAYSVIYKSWGRVKGMGWAGIQNLLAAINSDNRMNGVVASIILSAWRLPTQNLIEEIYKLKPFVEFCGVGTKSMEIKIIGTLAERNLALCGDPSGSQWVRDLCIRTGTTPDKWIFDVMDTAISFVRNS